MANRKEGPQTLIRQMSEAIPTVEAGHLAMSQWRAAPERVWLCGGGMSTWILLRLNEIMNGQSTAKLALSPKHQLPRDDRVLLPIWFVCPFAVYRMG